MSEQLTIIDKLMMAKAHMDYCRTLVPLEEGDVLADGIEKLKERIAELEGERDGLRRDYLLSDIAPRHARAKKRIAELERALRQVQPDTQHYKDGDGGCFIDCPYCTIEQALKGGGE